MKALSAEFPVKSLCRVLGVGRSAYYSYLGGGTYRLKGGKSRVAEEVKKVFDRHRRRYGWRRIKADLEDAGIRAGRHQIRNRMREQGLVAIQPKGFVPRTTQGGGGAGRSPNLLLEEANLPTAPGQVFVGDITYLPNREKGHGKWLFLAVWMDLFSRRVPGWRIERHMEESLVRSATDRAVGSARPAPGLIVHSDGGGQYRGRKFRESLELHGFRQSMTRRDNHYDNAFAESLFSRFKAELLDGGTFHGLEDARLRTFEFIDGYYNTVRRHSSIGNISPLEFEKRFWAKSPRAGEGHLKSTAK